jgi:sucrose-phosphate synthase
MNKNNKGKYLVLISIHGLIRSTDLELGRDADTGGQTKYVVDLAKALAECDEIQQIDLITRRIVDSNVSNDYGNPIEALVDKVRIVRIDAGPEVHTGHSLGRDKRKRLLARGVSREEIELTYNMERRIDAEEEILANADLVITSTLGHQKEMKR